MQVHLILPYAPRPLRLLVLAVERLSCIEQQCYTRHGYDLSLIPPTRTIDPFIQTLSLNTDHPPNIEKAVTKHKIQSRHCGSSGLFRCRVS